MPTILSPKKKCIHWVTSATNSLDMAHEVIMLDTLSLFGLLKIAKKHVLHVHGTAEKGLLRVTANMETINPVQHVSRDKSEDQM